MYCKEWKSCGSSARKPLQRGFSVIFVSNGKGNVQGKGLFKNFEKFTRKHLC